MTEARLSADGTRMHLTLVDGAGDKVLLSFPVDCLNTVLSTVPRRFDRDMVHRLDSWSMAPSDNSQELLLTLRPPEGLAISFALKSWQVEGMATIATYGKPGSAQPRTTH
jgi:hypothetical protein